MKEEHKAPEEHHHVHHEIHSESKPSKNKAWATVAIILGILVVLSVFTHGFTDLFKSSSTLSKEEASEKVLLFVNKELLQGQTVATLKSVTEEGDLYAMTLDVSGQVINSYVTKDGKIFFPQGLEVEKSPLAAESAPSAPSAPSNIPKSDKPKVELFVMSHCPFGTQAEKGILPVVEKLGSKIDFDLKFVYYAMHGQTELNEEMNQVCIKNEQKDKFTSYLTCFLGSGDGNDCLTKSSIDKTKLTACVKKLDATYSVTKKYADKSTWLKDRNGQPAYPLFDVYKAENNLYGVGGSPTLVINGQEANSDRSPAGYLSAICAAFNTAPEECALKLSTASYSSGFGYDAAAGSTANAAACGN